MKSYSVCHYSILQFECQAFLCKSTYEDFMKNVCIFAYLRADRIAQNLTSVRIHAIMMPKQKGGSHMTGEEFVKLCHAEKESVLREYFRGDSESRAAEMIRSLVQAGTDETALHALLDLVLSENWYTMLLGLDGAASLGGEQITYQLYDEDETLLNPCGEIEEAAYSYFMEEPDDAEQ